MVGSCPATFSEALCQVRELQPRHAHKVSGATFSAGTGGLLRWDRAGLTNFSLKPPGWLLLVPLATAAVTSTAPIRQATDDARSNTSMLIRLATWGMPDSSTFDFTTGIEVW